MLRNYLSTAFRSILKNRFHALVNTVGLAIGFSGMMLIMLWVYHEWTFDRFHEHSPRLYRVLMNYGPGEGEVRTLNDIPGSMAANIAEKVADVESVTRILTIDRWPGTLCFKHEKDTRDACFYRNGIFADDNFFSMFTYPIIAGEQNPFSKGTHIAISRSMSEDVFGGVDPIGKRLVIDGWVEVTVASVFEDVPANSTHQFDFVLPFAPYRKLTGAANDDQFRNDFSFETYLKSTEKLDTAQFNRTINQPDIRSPRLADAGASFFVQPLADQHLYDHFENGKIAGGRIDYVMLFFLVGIVVLVIACINYVNLATSRAMTRAREVGVRKVNGASRAALILQFLGESFISVVAALIIAVGLVQLLLPLFNQLVGERLYFNLLNYPFSVFLPVMLMVVTLAAGIYPAFVMSGFSPARALKNKITAAGTVSGMRRSLTVAQLLSSCVLIIFTLVLFMQIDLIRNKHLGYDRHNILRIEPTYRLLTKWEEFRTALLSESGVVNASVASGDLLNIPFTTDEISWPGKRPDEKVPFKVLSCGYDFLETFSIKVIEGRTFSREFQPGISPIIVTRSAARQMGFDDPIGGRISYYGQEAEIIGVVEDIHARSLHHAVDPVIFTLSKPERLTAIYVKYSGDTDHVFKVISNVYDRFEPDFSMVYWYFDESFDKQYKVETVTRDIAVVFTLLAISISILGVIGLSSYNILRRMREIGIRKVFGASSAQVVAILSGDFVKLVLISALIACPLAAWLSDEWLDNFATRIAVPWYVYVVAIGVLLLITIAAIAVQSIRAALTNPSEILKDE